MNRTYTPQMEHTMKKLLYLLAALAIPFSAEAQRQNFLLPAYFATNVYLHDNTNLPLHQRVGASAFSNVNGWAILPAVTNVNVADYDLDNVGGIDLDLTPTGSMAAARMQWNSSTETARLGLDSALSMDIGQQQFAHVRNAESVTISNGTVVYISGATGDKASVRIASHSNDTLSARTVGIAAENITAGNLGFVVTRGPVYGQNTSAFNAGDMLWLGAYGNVTTNKPQAPLHSVFVGVAEKINANSGMIHVQVQNGVELDEIHDVNVTATSNTLLRFDGSVWTNVLIGSGLGVTSNQLVVTNVASGVNNLDTLFVGNINAAITNSTGSPGLFALGVVSNTSITANNHGAGIMGHFRGSVELSGGNWGTLFRGVSYPNSVNRVSGGNEGAMQSGVFFGTASIGYNNLGGSSAGSSYGAHQFGFLNQGTATILGHGAVQIMGGVIGEVYYSTGRGSLLLGPGTQTNAYGILANGPIQSLSGFVGNAANLTNFPSSILTVTAGNTNYFRITSVPASPTSAGSHGQMAISGTNLFLYSTNGGGSGVARWILISGTATW